MARAPREPKVRLPLDVPIDLFQWIDGQADDEDISRNALCIRILAEYRKFRVSQGTE